MRTAEQILLVDDEAAFLEILSKYFSRRKIVFKTAANCMEALDLAEKYSFDVIVLDVCMPGLDGFACMTELKKLSPVTEIIFLTGHATLNIGIQGMKQGAFDYCLKPVDFDDLYEKILLAGQKSKEGSQRLS